MALPIDVSVTAALAPGASTGVTPAVRPPLWMVKEDRALFGGVRSCAPCPAVVVLKEDSHAFMDEQWQYFQRGMNYNMTLENVYLLNDDHLAFANNTGFPGLGNPGERLDYFFRRNLTNPKAKPPALDKVRTCVRNVLTGREQYSLLQTIKAMTNLTRSITKREKTFQATRSAFASLLTTAANVLNVWTFDSRQPPPLKPGRRYPTRVEDADPDDYLYLPETHPWMFVVANIVNKAGDVVQFPRGALYPWTGDRTIYSFMPLISNHSYGDVLFPLTNLVPIAATAPIPRAYRSA